MGDTALEERFAEFEADAMSTFRPLGVAAAQRRVRVRRRRRRGMLAGVVALLLAGPAGAFAAAQRGDRPDPTPTVSPSPAGKLIERKLALPGVQGELTGLRFVDSRTGWALFDTCRSSDLTATGCVRTVARTTDAGATWQRMPLPTAPGGPAYLLTRDDQTLIVVAGDRYLVTIDGGASFTSHPGDSPPDAVQRAMATPSGLAIACPGAVGPAPGPPGADCDRERVVRVGGGPLPHQPPVTLRPTGGGDRALVEGGDGRLWLTVTDGDRLTVVTSDDLGTTWRKLPSVPGTPQLTVSPDGSEVWLVETDAARSVWRLVGNRWQQRPGLPDDTAAAVAAGGGALVVVSHYGGAGFWVDGRYVDVPELRDPLRSNRDAQAGVRVLPDGAVALDHGRTEIIGTGRGTNRTWTWIS